MYADSRPKAYDGGFGEKPYREAHCKSSMA